MGFALSSMTISSPAFEDGAAIPKTHSGEGKNVSPPLVFEHVPEEVQSFALICMDPDAPLVKKDGIGFVHWVVYNIPGDVLELKQGEAGYTMGVNDQDASGYTGPMPPKGHGNHRYFFHLLALDRKTGIKPNLTVGKLLKKIEPHVIAHNRLMGTYRR